MKIKMKSISGEAMSLDSFLEAEVTLTTPVDELNIYLECPDGKRRKMLKLFNQQGVTAVVVGSVKMVQRVPNLKRKKSPSSKSEAGHD